MDGGVEAAFAGMEQFLLMPRAAKRAVYKSHFGKQEGKREDSGDEDDTKRVGSKRARGEGDKAKRPKRRKRKKEYDDDGEELYCLCRKAYDEDAAPEMVMCDFCGDWYHFRCVGLRAKDLKGIKKYKCALCREWERQEHLRRESEVRTALARAVAEKRAAAAAAARVRSGTGLSPSRAGGAAAAAAAVAAAEAAAGERRRCGLPECSAWARPGSKFCKDSCGSEAVRRVLVCRYEHFREVERKLRAEAVAAVRLAVAARLPENTLAPIAAAECVTGGEQEREEAEKRRRTAAASFQPTALDVRELGLYFTELDALEQRMEDTKDEMTHLEAKCAALEEIIVRSQQVVGDEKPPAFKVDAISSDCVSCGHAVSLKTYTKHLDQCFAKRESKEDFMMQRVAIDEAQATSMCNFFDIKTRRYCHRLMATCPLHQEHNKRVAPKAGQLCAFVYCNEDGEEEFCMASKTKCQMHFGWEKLRRADLRQQMQGQLMLRSYLFNEAVELRNAITRRAERGGFTIEALFAK